MSANKQRVFFLKRKLARASSKKAAAYRKEIAELTGVNVEQPVETAPVVNTVKVVSEKPTPVVEVAPVVETVEVVVEKPTPVVEAAEVVVEKPAPAVKTKPKAKRSYRRKKTTTAKE